MKSKNAIKTFSMLFICLAIFGSAKAQDSTKVEQPTEVKSLNKLKLSLIGLSYEREQCVGKTTTIYGAAGLIGSFIYQTTITFDNNYNLLANTDTDFKIYPSLNAGFRHYYNFEKRVKKGKKTINNAAGYVGLDFLAIFPPKTGISNQYNIMPQWGFQAAASKWINFELALGPAIVIAQSKTYFDIGAKIGFNFLL
ncbi:hypothetical protein [Pedobacter roseus]|uniref:DUF3575 domain-containing protein n=1 Tax=Pedobacter roseus TaxID=336820 RepID=A0A7G9QCB8_9SPHI|nr:hypothetical protein [Pedobacter roseus]QNN40993.1 hypothetical protein H9L23_17965 [Pedobacter roseus]